MKPKHVVYLGMVAIAIALVWAGSVVTLGAQQAGSGAVAIDADEIRHDVSCSAFPSIDEERNLRRTGFCRLRR